MNPTLPVAERERILRMARAAALERSAPKRAPIEPVERGGRLALSFAQQRLWFLEQLGELGSTYHIPHRLRLRGTLDRAALARGLDRIVERHESLRTVFVPVDGEPEQRIVPAQESGFRLAEHDLRGQPDAGREVERLAARETAAPFDLERGPLVRACLVRLADDDHVLLVTMHHIVSDGWSTGVFTRELGALYTAFSQGLPDPLPPLAVQYADYAAWQRRRVEGEVLEAQAAYWTEALSGAPELLELPTDHARPPRQDFAGASVDVELDATLTAALRALGQRHGTTLFMTLLAGWATVLARLSGQDDVVIGTPSANRTRPEVEELIGFFVNVLPVRVDLAGGPRVAELLERVKVRALEAQRNQDIPLEQVVERLRPARTLAYTPLFQVLFAWQTGTEAELELPGLTIDEADEIEGVTAKFDLSLALWEEDGRIVGSVEYATALFERATVERFVTYLRRVLEGMSADDRQPVDRLPLLPAAERRRMVEAWNHTDAGYPRDLGIHDLFRAQAMRTPGAVALSCRGERTTYAELEARANRLANALRRRGVGPEVRVGICLPRTPELVVALLGVLKAGGAYVPLDPAYPRERLGWMLEDAAISLVVTDATLADRLPDAAARLLLDRERDAIAAESAGAPESGVLPENLSHVIFTSGSTGRPKGVMIRHASAVVLLHWLRETITDEERASVLFSTSINFDVSVAELFGTLCWGGKLVIAENALDLAALDEEVVHASMVPSAAAELLRTGGIPPCVRTMNLGGEALPNALAQGLYALGTVQKVGNLYGPTEDTTYSAYSLVPRGAERVTIGRPVANTQAYVLDAHLQPVPVGVAGELYLAGDGVARGYANRPGMTAERFLPCPFGAPGGRMYRVMDRARRGADGELEYLGRTDFQVKVRGFRIEPGEIEARLREHPGVRAAVVLAREDAPGDTRLVAYVAGDETAGAEVLRAHLAERLPGYMVPAAYVRLDALPLTPNGKVDRRALPAPEGDAFAARGYEAPVGRTEQTVAAIWAELLGAERVGRGDDFFHLGGHSLLAVRVAARVGQALGVQASPGDLFERPVLADFARAVEAAARADASGIPPVDRTAPIPLSFAQQRLWFLEQLGGMGAAYHVPLRLRFRGHLDRGALARALDRIVARHEALRTTFPAVDGEPVQRIAPAAESAFRLVEHDLQAAPDAEEQLRRLMRDEAGAPFDLEHGPLVRGRLVRMAADDHVLLLTMHHVVSDLWSTGVLQRELGALYAAFVHGEPDPLPPLPVQYADYAAWHRGWVGGPVLEAQAKYWTRALAGAPELLELPADHPRPARQDFAGATVAVELDETLTAALAALSRRHGTTLYMTLLAGWAVVLGRLSGQTDVVVGTPSANRGRPEVEELIGFFVNTLPVRVDLSDGPRVGELLERVKARALEAQRNQDIPFEQVVERLRPARSLAYSPLFQAMFAWQNAAGGRLELPGVTVADAGGAEGVTAKFDLLLGVGEDGGRITGALEYATALFDRATVERWVGYLRAVLAAMAADDAVRIDRIPILPDAERRLLLREWNATAADVPREACVHELFEAQAERTPGAVAVVREGERVTYAELNARANRLAHHLRALGVEADARVGICVERSVEMVVGLMAILKAGGAYVPLDSSYPVDRLRYMLEDSAPAVLLTHPPLADTVAALSAGSAVPVLDLTDAVAWAAYPETNPERGGEGPGSLAYVLSTSGSTGRPKGVMLEHGSLVNRLAWMQDRYGMGPGEALLQKTPFSFDVSFWEFFWPLMVGARLVMARPGGHRDPAYLAEVIRHEGITVAHFVPSMLQLFLEHPDAEKCTGLLRVPVSGEAVSAALVRQFHERLPAVKLTNQYGPTESGEVTEWACDPGAERVFIGRAIHNSTVYVLDRAGEPAPLGVAGELFIGGVAVARGYLDRPRLTAERFVPDPFASTPGARLYRTGDLCRWTESTDALTHSRTHALEFLGRTDFQVKVRGFRVELGEIEARLAEHPGVREAVVLALDDGAGGRRLVAYFVGEAVGGDALRAHLAEQLPEYMVPAAFVWMEAFPVTPNGKLDRRALPAPDAGAFAARGYEAPLGETEAAVAEIWAGLLGVEQVGRRDDFFALGGHSLLAVRVVSRIRQTLGVEAAVGDLFVRPVLADFARGLATAARADGAEIVPADRGAPIPPSFAQQRLWFLERLGGMGSAYHIPVRLRLHGRLDRAALERALDRIVARHEALRTTFPAVDGEPVQRIAPVEERPFRLVEHDLSGSLPLAARNERGGGRGEGPHAELRRLMAEEAGAPFDLERGPLFRGRLLRMAEDDHVLLLTMHHIVSDGWSAGVLHRELGALYAAFVRGDPDPLPPLPVQYADYAAWQRAWVDGPVLEAQAEYWTRALAGVPELLELPADHPRPARQDFAGASVAVELDEALAAALRALSQRHGTTLFMTLLAGWAVVLGRLSGQTDVVIGTPSANRGRAEVEELIGFFVNMLPVRIDLSGGPRVGELLARVKARALEAQRNQDIPFEQVVERVQPVRSLAYTPLFQVMFAWQNAPGGALELPGLTVGDAGGAEGGTAKFDLSLALWEDGGRIAGVIEYAAALFEPATAERFAGYLRRALEEMAAGEDRPVDRLPLLPQAERRLVLEEWNRTEAEYPRASCIHHLFERQAERVPGAVAVSSGGESLTYAELNARANRLAHHLRSLGVGPDVRVGICVERGIEMVVALLAVLKAGGAYLPLDPEYPRERLEYMLADSAPAVVLAQGHLRERLGDAHVPVLELDAAASAWSDQPATNPAGEGLTSSHLAYLIYTSGSTGRPKGVAIEHRNTVNLLAWAAGEFAEKGIEHTLFATSLNFDLAVFECFVPLAVGGTAHVVRDALALAREPVAPALVNTVPSAMAALTEMDGVPASVRTVNLAGEPLKRALVERIFATTRVETVCNLYGPSETTTYSTWVAMGRETGFVPHIGRPIANTRAYVLDAGGEPLPGGVAGELYLGGAGVARGYLGRPALTAERFVPDPFAAQPGARLYRTGDLARWKEVRECESANVRESHQDAESREDASTFALSHSRTFALEFLGRNDHQVKVRGFRIEPGEIEARLLEHPAVRQAAVVAREDDSGAKLLVAYVAGEGAEADDLRAHLRQRLPEHMVPAAFVRLDALPLTPNGKLDRAALPAPGGESYARGGYEAPQGETEETLAEIWAEVLGVERVGRRDNFFSLGGHSLLVVKLALQVERRMEVEIGIRDVFEAPVLADLARHVLDAQLAQFDADELARAAADAQWP